MKMKKFKEILFLKNLKGVGTVSINNKYRDILIQSDDVDELILKIKNLNSKLENKDFEKAKKKTEEIFDYVVNSDIHVITIFDESYPEKLSVMENNKPPILYVKGDVEVLEKSNIVVIGTRNPCDLSQNFEENLVKNTVNLTDKVVISGLALGCDKIAHQATVDENKITIAVLPSGVDVIKPAKNKNLAEDIIKTGGCLVSEFEPKVNPNRGSYVKRDKIVAALSDAVFVIECGIDSGTMHTVNFAGDYKKQIYAYYPTERPEGLFMGNEHILKEYDDAIEVEDIEEFINDLNTLSHKQLKTGQQTLM